MKRYQGLAVVLILGVVVLVASVIKRPSPKLSQHNSSASEAPANEAPVNAQTASPNPNTNSNQNANTMTRTMSRTATSQAETPAPQQMTARGANPNFVKHEISPLKRNVADSELRNSDLANSNWKLVTSLYAVPQAYLANGDHGSPVGEQNGFTFFEAGSTNLQESLFSNERPLVVYDPRLQTYGVVTGTVQIDLRKGADVASLLQEHGAKVEHAFPETGTYYITSQEQPFNFVQFKNSLEQDSRVNRTEIEIVSRRYGKQ